jgi:transcriptional regulator with XRE-family HTH domain
MDSITKEVGLRIRMYRLRQGMTQEVLAEKAELHHTYIGQVERGEKSLTLGSLERILRALNVTFSDFFENVEGCQERESVPGKCYRLLQEKSPAQQERLYRILLEMDELMKL